MNPPDQNDVSTALSLLRDSVSEEDQRIRNEGAKAMQEGDYDTRVNLKRKIEPQINADGR